MRFQKGQSGNPGGRPKSSQTMAAMLHTALRTKDPVTGKPHKQLVVEALIQQAEAGNMAAVVFIFERLDGKVPEQLQSDGTLTVRVVYDTEDAPALPEPEATE